MSLLKKAEEEYKKIIAASNIRVGFMVSVARKLTEKEAKGWPWGYQSCEKFIGYSRHITSYTEVGYILNGIDVAFPVEMLSPIGSISAPAPYIKNPKGVELFTGYQVIDEYDMRLCTSVGRVYQLYFTSDCSALKFLEDKKVEFLSNNHVVTIDGKIFFLEEIRKVSLEGQGFVEYFASK